MESSGGSRAWLIAASAVVVLYGVAAVLIRVAPDMGLHRHFVVPIVALLVLPIAFVGPARVLVGAHWTTDVLGAYLLGAGALIGLILLFEVGERRLNDLGLLRSPAQSSVAPPTAAL